MKLSVFDFDDTLLFSPRPPPPRADDDLAWWYSPYSLDGVGLPGFDSRWNLDMVETLRREGSWPDTLIMILTGRPGTTGMYHKIEGLVKGLDARVDQIQLRPITFPGTTAMYKAAYLEAVLSANPTIDEIEFWDDQIENHKQARKLLKDRAKLTCNLT